MNLQKNNEIKIKFLDRSKPAGKEIYMYRCIQTK